MGTYKTLPRDGGRDEIEKFRLEPDMMGEGAAASASALRRETIKHRDEMLEGQKMCAAGGDHVGAKFFKGEERHALRVYRACCLILPYLANDCPNDCKLIDPWQWPPELFPALAFVESRVRRDRYISFHLPPKRTAA